MSAAPLASVVVLSYDRPALLELALHSIASQTYPAREVLVIDNLSPSSPAVRDVVASFSGVRLVSCAANLGFTGGMNRGLAEASGEYVYLTEDDIELAPDCVDKLVAFLRDTPEVALAGPVMWNKRAATIRCAGGDFAFGSVFRMSVSGAGERNLEAAKPFRTRFLSGAMIAARTAELRRLGGFHQAFFMYREDIELCARVQRAGRAIAVVPEARVFHHEPAEAPEPAALSFHKHKNLGALYVLHAPLVVLPMFFVRYVIIDGIRRLLGNSAAFPTWAKAWTWVAVQSPSLFAERWKRG